MINNMDRTMLTTAPKGGKEFHEAMNASFNAEDRAAKQQNQTSTSSTQMKLTTHDDSGYSPKEIVLFQIRKDEPFWPGFVEEITQHRTAGTQFTMRVFGSLKGMVFKKIPESAVKKFDQNFMQKQINNIRIIIRRKGYASAIEEVQTKIANGTIVNNLIVK